MFTHYPLRLVLLCFMSIVVGMVGACGAMGIATATTFPEKLVYAKSTVTGARTVARQMVTSGEITADDAQAVQNEADIARASIASVEQLALREPGAASIRLDGIVAGLRGLATYLNSKRPNAPPLSVAIPTGSATR